MFNQRSEVMKDRKAQGALEYLIILSAVLAVAAITVLFITGAFSGQKSSAAVSNCKNAAANCHVQKATSLNPPCTECDSACKDPATGQDIYTGAAACCKAGKPADIFLGSTVNCTS